MPSVLGIYLYRPTRPLAPKKPSPPQVCTYPNSRTYVCASAIPARGPSSRPPIVTETGASQSLELLLVGKKPRAVGHHVVPFARAARPPGIITPGPSPRTILMYPACGTFVKLIRKIPGNNSTSLAGLGSGFERLHVPSPNPIGSQGPRLIDMTFWRFEAGIRSRSILQSTVSWPSGSKCAPQ